MLKFWTEEDLRMFAIESNLIEGEERLGEYDVKVLDLACSKGVENLEILCSMHLDLTKHLDVDWKGKWRDVNVYIGDEHNLPNWRLVPGLMLQYWDNFRTMDSWEAHNRFEKIHPFRDFNGRMGRLIWLSKAVREGYRFEMPFLQKFYYQSIKKYQFYK